MNPTFIAVAKQTPKISHAPFDAGVGLRAVLSFPPIGASRKIEIPSRCPGCELVVTINAPDRRSPLRFLFDWPFQYMVMSHVATNPNPVYLEQKLKSSSTGGALSALILVLVLLFSAVAEAHAAITLSNTGRTDAQGRQILVSGAELTSGYTLSVRNGLDADVYVVGLQTPVREWRAAFFVRDSHGIGIGVGPVYSETKNASDDFNGELLAWQRVDRDIDGDGNQDTEYVIGDDQNGFVVQLLHGGGVRVDDGKTRDIYCAASTTTLNSGAISQNATFWLPDMDGKMGHVSLTNEQADANAPWVTQSLVNSAPGYTGSGSQMKLPGSSILADVVESVDQLGRGFLFVDGRPYSSFSGSAGECAQAFTEGSVSTSLNALEPNGNVAKTQLEDLLIKMNYSLSGDWTRDYVEYLDYSEGTNTWIVLTGVDDQGQQIAWTGKIQEEREYVGNNSTRLRYLYTKAQLDTLVPGNTYQLSVFMEVTTNLAGVRNGAAARKRLTDLRPLASFTVDDGTGGVESAGGGAQPQ